VRIRARIARTGVQDYGDHAEYRPAEEVFAPESMKTFEGVALTVGHRGIVDSKNVGSWAIGYIADVQRDGVYLAGTLVITDESAAAAVERGDLVELSAGYDVNLDPTSGRHSGEGYDAVQRDIRANHVALLPRGGARCGSACSILGR
jgi:hypothetical protein